MLPFLLGVNQKQERPNLLEQTLAWKQMFQVDAEAERPRGAAGDQGTAPLGGQGAALDEARVSASDKNVRQQSRRLW